jgi:hypothetical protein
MRFCDGFLILQMILLKKSFEGKIMETSLQFLLAAALFSFFIPFACGIFPRFSFPAKPFIDGDSHVEKTHFIDVRFFIGMVMCVCFFVLGFECIPLLQKTDQQNEGLCVLFVIAFMSFMALMVSLKKNYFGWISQKEE